MTKKASKRGSALKKPVKISTALASVIGKGPMPRTEVTKKIWAYIKKKKLQHPKFGVLIKIDDKLKAVLKPSKKFKSKGKMIAAPVGFVWMMDMTKQLNKHIESSSVKVNPSKIQDDFEEEEEEDFDTYENPEEDDYEEEDDFEDEEDDDDYGYEDEDDDDLDIDDYND